MVPLLCPSISFIQILNSFILYKSIYIYIIFLVVGWPSEAKYYKYWYIITKYKVNVTMYNRLCNILPTQVDKVNIIKLTILFIIQHSAYGTYMFKFIKQHYFIYLNFFLLNSTIVKLNSCIIQHYASLIFFFIKNKRILLHYSTTHS